MSNEMKEWLEDKKFEDSDLYCRLSCALEHDMRVCESCRKCKGDNFAEIRMNLVRELAEYMDQEVPWDESR